MLFRENSQLFFLYYLEFYQQRIFKEKKSQVFIWKKHAKISFFPVKIQTNFIEMYLLSFKICMEENEISFTAINVMMAEAELAKSGVLLPCFKKHFMKDEMLYKITFCLGLKNICSIAFCNSWYIASFEKLYGLPLSLWMPW